jgi:hypothetical protein
MLWMLILALTTNTPKDSLKTADSLMQLLNAQREERAEQKRVKLPDVSNRELIGILLKTDDFNLKTAIIHKLAESGTEDRKMLLMLLSDREDADLRTTAFRALTLYIEPQDYKMLTEVYGNSQIYIKQGILDIIAVTDPIAEQLEVLKSAVNDTDFTLSTKAIYLLGSMDMPEAWDLLADICSLGDNFEKMNAISALARGGLENMDYMLGCSLNRANLNLIRTIASMEGNVDSVLVIKLKDEDVRIQWSAAYALGFRADSSYASSLIELLPNESSYLRQVALWGLGRMEAIEAIDKAQDMAVNDPEEFVREMAQTVFDRLNKIRKSKT